MSPQGQMVKCPFDYSLNHFSGPSRVLLPSLSAPSLTLFFPLSVYHPLCLSPSLSPSCFLPLSPHFFVSSVLVTIYVYSANIFHWCFCAVLHIDFMYWLLFFSIFKLCICGIFVTVHLILFVLLLFLWIFNTFSTSPVHVSSTNAN